MSELRQVQINGTGIENCFANLAMLADCPAQRVIPILSLGEVAKLESVKNYHEGS